MTRTRGDEHGVRGFDRGHDVGSGGPVHRHVSTEVGDIAGERVHEAVAVVHDDDVKAHSTVTSCG